MDTVSAIQDLIQTVARLRSPGGCPWDIEQDHRSLRSVLIEETAELLETIDRNDLEHMREELGDVLLQVVFHARIEEEAGRFSFDDVAREIHDKLVRRHPHVFGDVDLKDTAAVLRQWEAIKAEEKKNGQSQGGSTGVFKDLPPSLPALQYAADLAGQIRKRAPDYVAEYLLPEGVDEGVDEDLTEEFAGPMLFHLVAACQRSGVDPESALRQYATRVRDKIVDAAEGRSTV